MAAISTLYTNAVFSNLRPMFGNWEPSAPLAIGDYGYLVGQRFERMGNIDRFGLRPKVQETGTADHKQFTSDQGVSVKLGAAAQASAGGVNGSGKVEISFSDSGGVFFNAAGCNYSSVADKHGLGEQLKKLDGWDREWAVVTDVVQAGSTIIAISEAGGAKFVVEAKAADKQLNLADASLGFNISLEDKVGYSLVSQKPMPLLFGLCRLQYKLLQGTQFRAFSAVLSPAQQPAPKPAKEAGEPEFTQLQ